jgi:hypothetical protein
MLLGASLVIAAPAAMADSSWKQHKKQYKHAQNHTQKQRFAVRAEEPQYHRQKIHQRLKNQARKIHKGIKKGQLVRWEAKQLRREQRHINNRLENYRYDGRLNRHERKKIHRMLDRAADNISNKRHNRVTKRSQHNRYENHNRHEKYNRYNHQYRYPQNGNYEFVINW